MPSDKYPEEYAGEPVVELRCESCPSPVAYLAATILAGILANPKLMHVDVLGLSVEIDSGIAVKYARAILKETEKETGEV